MAEVSIGSFMDCLLLGINWLKPVLACASMGGRGSAVKALMRGSRESVDRQVVGQHVAVRRQDRLRHLEGLTVLVKGRVNQLKHRDPATQA